MLDRALARLAQHADAVRVVDDHDRPMPARELDDLGELREVALHREDAVRDDQLARAPRRGGEPVPQSVHVRVRVDDLRRRPREPDGVDEARVVELVGEDDRRLVGEARDAGLVRVPARDVGERRLGARDVRERALEREVRLEGAADEAHGCGARPVAAKTLDSRLDDLRMPREPEVVVRREDDHLAAPLHLHDRPLRRLKGQELLVRARVAERVELAAELLVERGHRSSGRSGVRRGVRRLCRESVTAGLRSVAGRSCTPPPTRAARTPPRSSRAGARR